MTKHYHAKVYIDKRVIAELEGDDLEKLHTWMLATANGKFGNLHGEISEKTSGKIVKTFRKSANDC